MSVSAPERKMIGRTGSFAITDRPPQPQLAHRHTESQEQPLVVVWGDHGPARDILHAVIDNVLPPTGVRAIEFDHSVQNRLDNPDVVSRAARSMQEVGFGVRSATVGPEDPESHGLPNLNIQLRRATGATAIVRKMRPFKGVTPDLVRGLAVVRYADDEATEQTKGIGDERIVIRREVISARKSLLVAKHAFDLAEQIQYPGLNMEGEPVVVYHGSRAANMFESYGVFDDAVAEASKGHPFVDFESESFDVLSRRLARLDPKKLKDRYLVIPAMEEPGDVISNSMLGRIEMPVGAVPSMTLALDPAGPQVVWTDTIHGLARKDTQMQRDRVNPVATILAVADVLFSMKQNREARFSGYRLRRAVHRIIEDPKDSVRPRGLGGNATTAEFISAVKGEL